MPLYTESILRDHLQQTENLTHSQQMSRTKTGHNRIIMFRDNKSAVRTHLNKSMETDLPV